MTTYHIPDGADQTQVTTLRGVGNAPATLAAAVADAGHAPGNNDLASIFGLLGLGKRWRGVWREVVEWNLGDLVRDPADSKYYARTGGGGAADVAGANPAAGSNTNWTELAGPYRAIAELYDYLSGTSGEAEGGLHHTLAVLDARTHDISLAPANWVDSTDPTKAAVTYIDLVFGDNADAQNLALAEAATYALTLPAPGDGQTGIVFRFPTQDTENDPGPGSFRAYFNGSYGGSISGWQKLGEDSTYQYWISHEGTAGITSVAAQIYTLYQPTTYHGSLTRENVTAQLTAEIADLEELQTEVALLEAVVAEPRAERIIFATLGNGDDEAELRPLSTDPVSVIIGDGDPQLITGVTGNDFSLPAGILQLTFHGNYIASSNASRFWYTIRDAADDSQLAASSIPFFRAGQSAAAHTAQLHLTAATTVNVEAQRDSGRNFSATGISMTVVPLGGAPADLPVRGEWVEVGAVECRIVSSNTQGGNEHGWGFGPVVLPNHYNYVTGFHDSPNARLDYDWDGESTLAVQLMTDLKVEGANPPKDGDAFRDSSDTWQATGEMLILTPDVIRRIHGLTPQTTLPRGDFANSLPLGTLTHVEGDTGDIDSTATQRRVLGYLPEAGTTEIGLAIEMDAFGRQWWLRLLELR